MHLPAIEVRRQVRRFAQHAITQIGSRNFQTDAADLRPAQIVLREKFADGRNPAGDDGVTSVLRVGRVLEEPGGDGLAVFPDRRDFGGGRAAVRADENSAQNSFLPVKLRTAPGNARIIGVCRFDSFNLAERARGTRLSSSFACWFNRPNGWTTFCGRRFQTPE